MMRRIVLLSRRPGVKAFQENKNYVSYREMNRFEEIMGYLKRDLIET